MNWPALFFAWLAGMAFWFSGYLYGLKIGHMRGHRCEAIYQQIYDKLPVKDNNDTP